MKYLIYLVLFLFLLQSCNSAPLGPSDQELSTMTRFEKWASLEAGMSEENVFRILGEPSSKRVWAGQTSYKFECFTCKTTFNKNNELWSWFGPSEKLK
ncbi:MAG: hypothetical protein JKY03_00380 [Aureispira sp.]|nr:hypothetical protein [Aureispira sp.]